MSGSEQEYFEFLSRTDHPVFLKDYSTSQNVNSPLNSIWNRVFAKQLVRIRAALDDLQLNLVPDTVTSTTIDDWETEYFNFTKPTETLSQRVSELVTKFNSKITMSVGSVIAIAEAITGVTPTVERSIYKGGWVIGKSILGLSTVLSTGSSSDKFTYLVIFNQSIPTNLLQALDQALTTIQKGGSSHKILAPIRYWVLGQDAIGIGTTLR